MAAGAGDQSLPQPRFLRPCGRSNPLQPHHHQVQELDQARGRARRPTFLYGRGGLQGGGGAGVRALRDPNYLRKNSPAPLYGTSRQTSTMPRPPAVHVHVSAAASARNAANISSARRGCFFSQSSARPGAAAACTHLRVRDHVARAPHALEREPASVFHAVAPDLTPGSGPWLPWLRDRQVHAGDPGEGPRDGDDSV